MKFHVYILRSLKNGSYYKGSTTDLTKRLIEHNSGMNISTKRYMPWEVVWSTETDSRSESLILEKKLNNITSRKRVEDFISKHSKQQ
ncbi:MAG: hypothetical protein Fur0041_20190 [Bacteroidia bacterium]